jgi:DNA-binding CsgD family transcriptional regulator/PAS domain-containing protein
LISERLMQIVSAAYEAALDEQQWPQVLELISAEIGGCASFLLVGDKRNGGLPIHLADKMPGDSLTQYAAHWFRYCPRFAFGARHPERPIFYDYLHTSEAEMDRSEFYDWLSSVDLRYYMAMRILDNDEALGWIAVQRTRRQGHIDEQQLRKAEYLLPHLNRAMRVAVRLSDAGVQTKSAWECMDSWPVGAILLDSDARVLFANKTACQIVGRGDALAWSQRTIVALRRGDALALQLLIASALTIDGPVTSQALSLARSSGARPYVLVATPISATAVGIALGTARALILVTDPEATPTPPAQLLQQLFGLTPRQAELACHLGRGLSIEACAAQMTLTRGSIRVYVEQIFAKTGVNRQADLVRLLSAIAMAASRRQVTDE